MYVQHCTITYPPYHFRECARVVNMRDMSQTHKKHLVPHFTGSFAIGEYIDAEAMDDLQLMRTDIYYEYALAMTSKTWPLKDALDTLIACVVQSGMQAMWEWQVRCVVSVTLSLSGAN